MANTQPEQKRKLSLPALIFIGMIAGILLGILFNTQGWGSFATNYIKPFGTIYINLLKFLVVPVVLFSLTKGVVSLKDLRRVGAMGVKTIVYFMITTAGAVIIGLVFANVFKGIGWFPQLETTELAYEAKSANIMQTIVNIFPDNAVKPMVEAQMLPLIVIALFLGAGILASGEYGARIGKFVEDAYEVVMSIMSMIIKLSPIGVFALMLEVVAVNGAAVVGSLALVILVAYMAYLTHVLVVYGSSVKFLSHMSIGRFFKGAAPAMITAFTTTSSSATLPVSIECANKLDAEPEVAGFVLPIGSTINMDGTAIYMGVTSVFIAAAYGVELTLTQMLTIVLTATLASIGTAGVSGAGMIMLAMVLQSVNLPVAGIALIAGVDKLFDMGRTSLNVTGDLSCTMWISRAEKLKKGEKVSWEK
ncbi:MAG: dicarboxylate/amino acid:cation symporter [Eubacteriales bacterium]|jgi:Na+/H+-dicarboxylate symporter|nr:dicarboxylate/amino acid:cation symporter [Eubacteriales bacterium]MDD4105113.1 dicarboxylate/amino acid:cation symporter [Eubacteriales bacterium]MDD4710380.1 dicarboxylate/amino acid:cation symporter [Eubacteriales bacterium]